MTYRLLIEYDGGDFCGWQRQKGQLTVQQAIEDALAVALRQSVAVVGSGRTDAGVHARGQVAHFSAEGEIRPARLRRSLNGLLPASIAVLDVAEAPEGFHARFDARRRTYRYCVSTAPRALDRIRRVELRPAPDFDRMNRAAAHLVGPHDFSAFCRARSATINRVCTVQQALWLPEERRGDWHFEIVANRFLHGMVRAIVGTLLETGRGKRAEDDIKRVLQSQDRREAGPAAPPHGLVLEAVTYAAAKRFEPDPEPYDFA